MPTHAEMKKQAYEAARRLIDQSQTGETDGPAIAQELGLTSAEDKNTLYHALFALKDEGRLRCHFPGGMDLPDRVW